MNELMNESSVSLKHKKVTFINEKKVTCTWNGHVRKNELGNILLLFSFY